MKKGKYYRHSLAKDLDLFIIKVLSVSDKVTTLRVAYIYQSSGAVLSLDTIKINNLDLHEWKEIPRDDDESGNLIQ